MKKIMERKRIPQELVEVLLSRRGYSLLLKGAPGTGKTILALEIIGLLRDSNAVYISSRVSPTALYEHFPWLDECLSPPEPDRRHEVVCPFRCNSRRTNLPGKPLFEAW
jgi:KaiC/GvpD/RAD55 family RecA-like ATPase